MGRGNVTLLFSSEMMLAVADMTVFERVNNMKSDTSQ